MEKTKTKTKIKKQPEGRADFVIVRNLYTFAIVRRLIILTIISFVCCLVALLAVFNVIQFKIPPQYVQLTEDGRIFPIQPLNIANTSDGEIIKFATESIKWVNIYDFKNWKDQLQIQSLRFTPTGWNNYLGTLQSTGLLTTLENQKMVVYPTFTGPTTLVKKGLISKIGRYSWIVDVPVKITLANGESGDQNNISYQGVVRVYIVRVPLEISLRGYAIQIYQFDPTRK